VPERDGALMARAMEPASDFCRSLRFLERWPAAVFFVSSGALLARIVEQPLRDLFPDGVAAE
jgi:hypothetical protein